MRNTEDVITAVYMMNKSLLLQFIIIIYLRSTAKTNTYVITKYINYGIHQLRLIYALLKYKLHKVGVSIISEAACQYHHIPKTPSQGLQDLPRRRASMATPP